MVDIARYFLTFTQNESCGKCSFGRIGTKRMLEILEKITTGKGTEKDLENLENLAAVDQEREVCVPCVARLPIPFSPPWSISGRNMRPISGASARQENARN